MSEDFEVAIVGASVSGASLAVQLGARGVKVVLIDRDRFPRRKACGEGVSDIAINALYRFGFTEGDIKNLFGKPFFTYRMDFGKWSMPFASGRKRILKGIGFQRLRFDKMLVDRASGFPSVEVLTESTVSDFEHDGRSFDVTLKSGRRVSSRFLVLADGANSMSATKLGIPRVRNKKTHWGISYVLEGGYHKSTGEVLVLLKDGFEVYCTPVCDRYLNVAILSEKRNVRRLQDPGLIEELLNEASEKSSFEGTVTGRPLQVGPIGTRRPCYHGSTLLIGDAAESLDPVAGMGITHGILTAELAGEALCAVLNGQTDEIAAFEKYAEKCESMSRPLRGFTRLTGSLLRARFRSVLIPFASRTGIPYLVRRSLSAGSPSIFHYFLNRLGL